MIPSRIAKHITFVLYLSSPREIRTMILPSTCSGSDPRKQQEMEKGAEEGKRMTIFRESSSPPNVFTRHVFQNSSYELENDNGGKENGEKFNNLSNGKICKKRDREQAFPQK